MVARGGDVLLGLGRRDLVEVEEDLPVVGLQVEADDLLLDSEYENFLMSAKT